MKEYTIQETAEILEISKSTVRRRIKSGKLKAELKPGPYGKQYYIPENELDQAVTDKEVMDIKEVSQPIDKEKFLSELTDAIGDDLSGEIEKVEDNLKETIKQENKGLKKDIQRLTRQLKKLKEQQNKSLLEKIKNYFRRI